MAASFFSTRREDFHVTTKIHSPDPFSLNTSNEDTNLYKLWSLAAQGIFQLLEDKRDETGDVTA
jgi:hypothetical protein